VLVDEIQYAPELFPYLKLLVDASEERGQCCLTGSQSYLLMQGGTESLAGRIAILEIS
jgi:predicted AAA+ superfamily ATPase